MLHQEFYLFLSSFYPLSAISYEYDLAHPQQKLAILAF